MPEWLVFSFPLLAVLMAYLIGRMNNRRARRSMLALLILAPLLAYHFTLLVIPPAQDGNWRWWAMGLMALAGPFFLWLVAALVGYELSRNARRQDPYR